MSTSFSLGSKKKTPFQLHKEAEAEKKKKADEEAAAVYNEFVESFAEGPQDRPGSRAFVRGEVIQPGQAASAAAPPMAMPGVSATKPRKIDFLLENMKKEQEKREERQRLKEQGVVLEDDPDGVGSFDDGDPHTTNLYIGNLAPDLNEEILKKEFGRFGPLASVKIMWPRDDDQRRRGRNCGFVAFMNRADAARAKDELNDVMLHDNELHIGWGKSIPIPAQPMFVLAGHGGSQLTQPKGAAIAPPGFMASNWDLPPPGEEYVEPDVEVQIPADLRQRYVIDSLAAYVLRDGTDIEQAVMTREHANAEFAFLFNLTSPEHIYYRWRLFSLAQEDSMRSWKVEPFQLVEGAARWIPPPMTMNAGGPQQTAAQRGGELLKDKPLPETQQDRFEDLLRALTLERADICDAMVFALDNSDSAYEVVEILTDALTLSETPVPTKVARLFLVSDILHNSTAAVRNASRYRNHLEATLPDIFESFQESYAACESRIVQEGLRRHVLRVLRMWRHWYIFTDDFLNGLQATFLRSASSLSTAKVQNPELEAELMALSEEDLALKCRRSGLSRKGDRVAQVQRLLELHSYLNGGAKQQPPSSNADHSSVWRKQQEATAAEAAASVHAGNRPVLAAMEEPEAQPEPAVRPAVKPISQWAAVEDVDEPAGPISEWITAAPPPDPEPAEDQGKPAPTAAQGPVSKWTLVDYDDEDAQRAHDAGAEDDAEMEDEAAGAAADGTEGAALFSGAGAAPVSEAAVTDADTPSAPVASTKSVDLTYTAADEERRQRLRQVEVAVMVFREQLAEDEPSLSKEQLEARSAEHRSKLVAEAEAKLEQEAKTARSKEGRSRLHDRYQPTSDVGREGHKGGSSSRRDDSRERAPGKRKRSRSCSPDGSSPDRDTRRHRDRGAQRGSRSIARESSKSERERDRSDRDRSDREASRRADNGRPTRGSDRRDREWDADRGGSRRDDSRERRKRVRSSSRDRRARSISRDRDRHKRRSRSPPTERERRSSRRSPERRSSRR
eukprot:jgi/Astpho2/9463/Aster-x1581